ncbi:ATPase [uncultured Croceicoccus sp.]|uniref:HdaA/DnaA family protein n=1 Tax=uncultured Croceicoccus sp. TaxID=1295329 RepID=UPI00263A0E3E|nr:ATPase [uncultured Croceicoccus sp.]
MARQIPLPLAAGDGEQRIVVGNANEPVLRACQDAANWPFRTALLSGPRRSGRSLIARWFMESGQGHAIDDAEDADEAEIFHAWNRAQAGNVPLLIIGRPVPDVWPVRLPDLRSRLSPALNLAIGEPDDAMLAALIEAHARQRGLVLGEGATTYLVPRCTRSFAGVEELVARIDRISLERKSSATLAIWREALARPRGPVQDRPK